MKNTHREQDNRYLESPYVIRDTRSGEQRPFSIKNPIRGGFSFSAEGFSIEPVELDRAEKDNPMKED